jgi:alpha-mannosidase
MKGIKYGENDEEHNGTSPRTVILRLYQAFGGHAHAQLRIASHFLITQAHMTNFLEDEEEELEITRAYNDVMLRLDFRGFEVKTVKLVIGGTRDG